MFKSVLPRCIAVGAVALFVLGSHASSTQNEETKTLVRALKERMVQL